MHGVWGMCRGGQCVIGTGCARKALNLYLHITKIKTQNIKIYRHIF